MHTNFASLASKAHEVTNSDDTYIHSYTLAQVSSDFIVVDVPPLGLLLYGPPGVGKTFAVRTVANLLNASVIVVDAGIIMSTMAGESARLLRESFQAALLCSNTCNSGVAMASKRDSPCAGGSSRLPMQRECSLVSSLSRCVSVLLWLFTTAFHFRRSW